MFFGSHVGAPSQGSGRLLLRQGVHLEKERRISGGRGKGRGDDDVGRRVASVLSLRGHSHVVGRRVFLRPRGEVVSATRGRDGATRGNGQREATRGERGK